MALSFSSLLDAVADTGTSVFGEKLGNLWKFLKHVYTFSPPTAKESAAYDLVLADVSRSDSANKLAFCTKT